MTYSVITEDNSINDSTDNDIAALQLGDGDNALITADGYVVATGINTIGVYLNADTDGSTLTVDGLVSGNELGLYVLGEQDTIVVNGDVYDGLDMEGAADMLTVGSKGFVSGLDMTGTSDQLINDGTISVGDSGIQIGSVEIVNNGTISSGGFGFFYEGGNTHIENTGTIQGDFETYSGTVATDSVTIDNSGHWTDGAIGLTAGADTVNNTGTIDGALSLGGGNDTYSGANGHIYGEVLGGAGNDVLTGGSEDDTFAGGAGFDTMDGGGGVNTLDYAQSATGVYIDLSLDIAKRGDAAGDKIAHFQNVTGTLANDTLIGDAGDNTLIGVLGSDHMTGNAGNDTFLEEGLGHAVISGDDGNDVVEMIDADAPVYGHALTAADQIDGGAGYDTLELSGNYYSTTFVFHPTTMVNVEQIDLDAGNGYRLQTDNATVAAGQTLTVDGTALGTADHLVFNGTAETDGHFYLEGGAGVDTLTGGSDGDTFVGGGLGDHITAGAGADTFLYTNVEDSTSTTYDTISGFSAAHDVFQLDVAVAHIDAGVSASVSTATLSTDLKNAANGHLNAGDAILITANAGTLSGHVFLIVDANGTAGYQSHGDYVMDITGYTGTVTTADFTM